MFILTLLLWRVTHADPARLLPHLLATLFYCHSQVFGSASSIAPVAWSLEVEVQFYILAPLLTEVFRIRNRNLRRGLLVLAILAIATAQMPISNLRFLLSIGNHLQFFLAGFLVADLFLQSSGTKGSIAQDAFSAVGWPAAFLLPKPAVQVVLPLLSVWLCWAAFRGRILNWFFRRPFIAATGGMCYTIYLLHFPMIAAATRLSGNQRPWVMCLEAVALTSLVSSAYYLLIERPCMNPRWPQELGERVRRLWNRGPEGAMSMEAAAAGGGDATAATLKASGIRRVNSG
jgi:peptidoglycan/LPS O-acetylase OafA/YrhL